MLLKNIVARPSMRVTWLDKVLAQSVLKLVPHSIRPNQFTVMRLALTPCVAWLLLTHHYSLGIIIFLFATTTDLIDGALARTRQQITDWGTLYDPIADKFLTIVVAAILMFIHTHWAIPTTIIGVEILLIAYTLWTARRKQVRIQPNLYGKWKGFCLAVGFTLLMGYALSLQVLLRTAAESILVIAIALAIMSAIAYARRLYQEP